MPPVIRPVVWIWQKLLTFVGVLCEMNNEKLKPSETSVYCGVLCNVFVQLSDMWEMLRRETYLEEAFKTSAVAVVLHNAYKYSILMVSNATELAGIATLWVWVADMEPVRKLKISASVWNLTVTSRSSTLKPSHSADPRQLKPKSQRNTTSPSSGSSLKKESTTCTTKPQAPIHSIHPWKPDNRSDSQETEGALPFSKESLLEINMNQLNPIHNLTHCFWEVLVQL